MNNFTSGITFLQTDDLAETTKFYSEILECPVVVDQGMCKIFQITKESFIGFCSHDFLEKDQKNVCLTFVCDSKEEVDEWFKVLKEKQVKVKEPPKENTKFKIYNFFANDPNGFLIEVQYFLHPFP